MGSTGAVQRTIYNMGFGTEHQFVSTLCSVCNRWLCTQKMIAAYTGLSKQTVNTVIRALKESGYTAAKQTSSFPHKKEIRHFGAQTRDLAKRSRV